MLQTKNLKKSCGTIVEAIYYALKAINFYLEWVAFSVSTIC